MKKIIFLIALFFSLSIQAQTQKSFNISIGGSFPLGKFASFTYDPATMVSDAGWFDVDGECGAASSGLNVGFELLIPLKNERFSFTISADLNYNGIKKEAINFGQDLATYLTEGLKDEWRGQGYVVTSASGTLEKSLSHFNVPLLAGLRYTLPLKDDISLFAEGGVGLNLRFISAFKTLCRINFNYRGSSQTLVCKNSFGYEMKPTLAFRLGVGINVTKRLSLSAYYYYLGTGDVISTIGSEVSVAGSTQQLKQKSANGTITPMMAVVKLGFSF